MTEQSKRKNIGILNVFKSVLSSFFGVQSTKNRERDFAHGKSHQYIVVGLIVTVTFILTLWAVVTLVLRLAGV